MSSRFAPRGHVNPNSRFANLSAILHGPTAVPLGTLGEVAPLTNSPTRQMVASLLEPTSIHEATASKAATTIASAPGPATKVHQDNRLAATPKPMPVPSYIDAMGPACAQAYRHGFRAETQRGLRLLAHPVARGRHIAVGKLLVEGLSDAEIIARLPQEATDDEQRAKTRQAEISGMWMAAARAGSGFRSFRCPPRTQSRRSQ